MLKINIFFCALILKSSVYAHALAAKKHIYISIEKDINWNVNLAEKHQKYMGEHVVFMRNLRVKNALRLVFSQNGHHNSHAILIEPDMKKAKALLSKNKAFKYKTLKYTLRPVTIFFESGHTHK